MADLHQKLNIVNYFIKNTHVGEIGDVLNDLRKIVGQELLDEAPVREELLNHYAKHRYQIDIGGAKVMCSEQGQNGDQFLDPKLGKIFTLDPYTGEVSGVEDAEVETSATAGLQQAVDQYVGLNFSDLAQARVFSSNGIAEVIIGCSAINLRNFWTGEWLSSWKIDNGAISGKITFNAHYFEDGNIVLNREVEFSGDGCTSPEACIAKIKEFDTALNQQMNQIYEMLPEQCFRAMRRMLPVTKTKFADIQKHKLVS